MKDDAHRNITISETITTFTTRLLPSPPPGRVFIKLLVITAIYSLDAYLIVQLKQITQKFKKNRLYYDCIRYTLFIYAEAHFIESILFN